MRFPLGNRRFFSANNETLVNGTFTAPAIGPGSWVWSAERNSSWTSRSLHLQGPDESRVPPTLTFAGDVWIWMPWPSPLPVTSIGIAKLTVTTTGSDALYQSQVGGQHGPPPEHW